MGLYHLMRFRVANHCESSRVKAFGTRMKTRLLALALASALPPSLADAQTSAADQAPSEPNRTHKQGKVLRALRISATPPSIDGQLSDEVWRLAEVGGVLTQRDPDNGKPMTDQTRVQIAFDDRFLYVAVTALDSSPVDIAAGLGRRDETPPTETGWTAELLVFTPPTPGARVKASYWLNR